MLVADVGGVIAGAAGKEFALQNRQLPDPVSSGKPQRVQLEVIVFLFGDKASDWDRACVLHQSNVVEWKRSHHVESEH